jgi:hypothetical protein
MAFTVLFYVVKLLPDVMFTNTVCKGEISAISCYFYMYFYISETYGLMMVALLSRNMSHP